MSKTVVNRPFKFGEKDRREFIVQDSDVSLATINDTSGNIIFLGRAKAGTLVSENKWQIRKLQYDSNKSVIRQTWPQDSFSNASTDYEFIWSSITALTITGISQGNPGVATVSDLGTLQNGDKVVIQSVVGMTEVNFDGSNIYTVANIAAGPKTFELSGINTTAYTLYTSGGSVTHSEAINYTYS